MNLRTPAAIAATAALAAGAAACGSDSSSSSSSSKQSVKPVAKVDSLSGKATSVTLDAGFVKALQKLNVTPAPVGDASISKAGVASFPITGGNVTYYKPGTVSPYVQGTIRHKDAGLSLTAGGKTVKLTNFVIDPGKSVLTGDVAVNGKTAVKNTPLFFLNGNTLQPLKTTNGGSVAILQGTTVELKPSAAQLLDKTFGITALEGGLKIGVAKIAINTQA